MSAPAAGVSRRVLLTGATGHVGTYVARELLRTPGTEVLALVRARDEAHLRERQRTLREQVGDEGQRLHAVRGDITQPGLGLPALPEVDEIIHGAASIRFDQSEHDTAIENVGGTLHVLDVARALAETGRLRRLDYIGTCYVAGDRRGRVYETECDVGQGFRNAYEATKCRAEMAVRLAIAQGLPAAIHRPAIVVGESGSGFTRAFNVVYAPLRTWMDGRFRLCPGSPDTLVDLVPVDWLARALVTLQADPATLGGCHALAVGDGAPTMREIEAWAREVSGAPPLLYVDQDRYRRYVRPLLRPFFLTPRGRRIRRVGEVYLPYLQGNPRFDTSVADARLGPAGRPPPVRDYIEAILRFAVERRFGRS